MTAAAPREASGLRHVVYRQLFPRAVYGHSLSAANHVVVVLIVLATVVVVLDTEPKITQVDGVTTLFRWCDAFFGTAFAVEYALRLWSVGENPHYRGLKGRLRYALTPIALIDLIAIAPFVLSMGMEDALVLRVVRLMRILTLARLGGYSDAARMLFAALHSRRHELTLSLSVAFLALIVSATLLYTVEGDVQPDAFGSIPRAMWWSVVTLTTIGYGDVYPTTVLGRVAGGLVAMCAIGVIAMPTGILAAAFSEAFQQQARHHEKVENEARDHLDID
ncbi:MAG: ion transporter [Rhodospirillales bacterium]